MRGLLKALLLTALAMLLFACNRALALEEPALATAYQEGTIIRLHILAASDSPADQQAKLLARDAVLAAFQEQLAAQADDPDMLYALLQDNAEEMRQVAEDALRQAGRPVAVNVEVGVLHLPEKVYGEITLPEGDYRGLRLTLGAGEGHNWWCVLYPSLCLAAASDDPWTVYNADDPWGAGTLSFASQRIFRQWLLWP